MNEIIQTINTVGFPIACVLGLGWYVKYLTDTHRNQVDKMAEAVNNNTQVLIRICEKLEASGLEEE